MFDAQVLCYATVRHPAACCLLKRGRILHSDQQSTGNMDHPLSLHVLILAALSLLLAIMSAEDVKPENTRSSFTSQVQDMIPTLMANAADIASNPATVSIRPAMEQSASLEATCNTTALFSMLDSCATPDRISNWIKMAKPFIRLMSTVEASRNKNVRNG